MHGAQSRDRLWWAAVGGLALVGLALRLAAAQGGLWTDEAWSAIYAAQARDPIGVFLRINHDNNHHLNSLWLQAIGLGASPLLARAPSILAGSACVVVAAILAGRRSRIAGLVAALLFAVSPILVIYGSEARGYATMLLAALLMLLIVSDAVDGTPVQGARWWLAVLAFLGMFSHLTMAATVGIGTLWFYLGRRADAGPDEALTATLHLMGPALAATVGVVLFVFTAGALSPTGMRTASYEPYSIATHVSALDHLALWSVGFSAPSPWIVPLFLGAVGLFLFGVRPKWLGSRARLYALLLVAAPAGVALVHLGNSSFARFYLTSAIGLLLLFADWIGRGLEARPAARAGAAVLIGTLVTVSVYRDLHLIAVDRGHPDLPVTEMAALSPTGARIAFDAPRLKAVVAVAAAEAGYPARFAGGCAPADFLLVAQSRGATAQRTVDRCGVPMDAVDSSVTIPLTGDSWILYRAKTLQSPKSADSGRAPAAGNRRISGRAGVAQG